MNVYILVIYLLLFCVAFANCVVAELKNKNGFFYFILSLFIGPIVTIYLCVVSARIPKENELPSIILKDIMKKYRFVFSISKFIQIAKIEISKVNNSNHLEMLFRLLTIEVEDRKFKSTWIGVIFTFVASLAVSMATIFLSKVVDPATWESIDPSFSFFASMFVFFVPYYFIAIYTMINIYQFRKVIILYEEVKGKTKKV